MIFRAIKGLLFKPCPFRELHLLVNFSSPDLTKEYLAHRGAAQTGGSGGGGGKNFQPAKNLIMRYSNRINLDRYDGPRVSHAVRNQISEAAKRNDSTR